MDINVKGGGITFTGLLQIAFIVLKLFNVIEWSWLWVLAPTWIPLAVGLVILVVLVVIAFISGIIEGANKLKK